MQRFAEILRYMGHKGQADDQLDILISSCLEKLESVCDARHVVLQMPCTVTENNVTMDMIEIKSSGLAVHLFNCTHVFIFAATLGAAVDRLIAQRSKIDSAEALCLQACAVAKIENFCDGIEHDLSHDNEQHGLFLRPRFSPGYCDFDIKHQKDILQILQAHKRIGVSETNTHMLTPMKSVTALVGISRKKSNQTLRNCNNCNKSDCNFRHKETSA